MWQWWVRKEGRGLVWSDVGWGEEARDRGGGGAGDYLFFIIMYRKYWYMYMIYINIDILVKRYFSYFVFFIIYILKEGIYKFKLI